MHKHERPLTEPECNVLAAVIVRDGKFLICRRPSHKRHGSLWEFPGGKVEVGESLQQAARRELAEELGLRVTHVGESRRSIADPDSTLKIHFVDVQVEGTPKMLEHTAIGWVSAEELLHMPLAPADRLFAEFLNGPST